MQVRPPNQHQGGPSLASARGSALGFPSIRGNAFSSGTVPRVAGPSKYLAPMFNPQTTANLYVTDVGIEGLTSKDEMHEHGAVFNVKMLRTDFAELHVVLSAQQLNVFLNEVHHTALSVYRTERKTNVFDLSAVQVHRLVRTDKRLEILQFLCPELLLNFITFVGVQFGNRFPTARTGPGIAVITDGWATMRNTCINGCHDQDQLWWVIRRRAKNAPLSVAMEAYTSSSGPTISDRQYIDLAGRPAWGPAIRIGTVLDKSMPDLPTQAARELASGLSGSAEESHYAELNAPTFRVLLSVCGTNMYRS